MSKRRTRKGHKKARKPNTNVLLPDSQTLDRYLARFYGFMANGTYEGAAVFTLIPTWIRFLQSKELVTEEEGYRTLKSLQSLSQSMVQISKQSHADPILAEHMNAWRENAGI